jgi:RNA polymerase sigma-70 factor, ECF subfamily
MITRKSLGNLTTSGALRGVVARKLTRSSDDSILLAGIQARDACALQTLYCDYRSRLTRFLRRFTRCHQTIEEVINDSLMAVWMHASEFRGDSQVSTWIFGITYRTAMKALRRRPKACSFNDMARFYEPAIDPAADAELRDWLHFALGELAIEQRLCLTLAYEHGYTVDEIANIVTAAPGTVKSRMFLGRVKLRAIHSSCA